MRMDLVAGSGNDEYYTPQYAVKPILRYVPTGCTVWCPFDLPQSNYVTMLREHGCNVIATHIATGQDFFEYAPAEYDCIISNPPYSCKTEVLQRLFSLRKPFAMLVGVVGLFESKKRFEMFENNDFEIMYMDKRCAFLSDYKTQKPNRNPPFQSVYLCHKMLPEKIIFERIEKA